MPDKRTHRGPHPQDGRLFAPDQHVRLREAVADLSWLLARKYAVTSALKLVGDRHSLTERQRMAVWRSACGDESLAGRLGRMRSPGDLTHETITVDGYNLLITIESALGGGVILIGRDGCYRDLAGLHGTYRKVKETLPAILLIGEYLAGLSIEQAEWYLDSPVSNSGRLRGVLLDVAGQHGWNWQVRLQHNPDRQLVESGKTAVSSDSWVLDHCASWANVPRTLIEARIPGAHLIDLRSG